MGDIHGQLPDLLHVLNLCGPLKDPPLSLARSDSCEKTPAETTADADAREASMAAGGV